MGMTAPIYWSWGQLIAMVRSSRLPLRSGISRMLSRTKWWPTSNRLEIKATITANHVVGTVLTCPLTHKLSLRHSDRAFLGCLYSSLLMSGHHYRFAQHPWDTRPMAADMLRTNAISALNSVYRGAVIPTSRHVSPFFCVVWTIALNKSLSQRERFHVPSWAYLISERWNKISQSGIHSLLHSAESHHDGIEDVQSFGEISLLGWSESFVVFGRRRLGPTSLKLVQNSRSSDMEKRWDGELIISFVWISLYLADRRIDRSFYMGYGFSSQVNIKVALSCSRLLTSTSTGIYCTILHVFNGTEGFVRVFSWCKYTWLKGCPETNRWAWLDGRLLGPMNNVVFSIPVSGCSPVSILR